MCVHYMSIFPAMAMITIHKPIPGRAASPRIRETLRAPRGGHALVLHVLLEQCCGDVQGVAAALLGPDLG